MRQIMFGLACIAYYTVVILSMRPSQIQCVELAPIGVMAGWGAMDIGYRIFGERRGGERIQ